LVFDPVGLQTARLAVPADDLAGMEMGGTADYNPGWVYHGLVTGTVGDAARLLHSLMTGKLLRPSTLSAILKGHPLPQHRSEAHPNSAYGLGAMLSATGPHLHPIGHTGEGPGSRITVYALADQVVAIWTTLPADDDVETTVQHLLSSPVHLCRPFSPTIVSGTGALLSLALDLLTTQATSLIRSIKLLCN